MSRLALCMIVRDEEKLMRRALESAAPGFDEIVIVDTGSKDRTCEIAASFPRTTVLDFEWRDDFSEARNFAFEHCRSEWMMWMDADDFLDPKSLPLLRDIRECPAEGAPDAWAAPYFLSPDDPYKSDTHVWRERILHRRAFPAARWTGRVHERITPLDPSRLGRLRDFRILHSKPVGQIAKSIERNLRILRAELSAPTSRQKEARLWALLSRELGRQADFEGARSAWEQAVARGTLSPEGLYAGFEDLAQLAFQAGEGETARSLVDRASRILPPCPRLGFLRAQITFSVDHNPALAAQQLQSALTSRFHEGLGMLITPAHSGRLAHLQLSRLYGLLGRSDLSRTHFEKSQELSVRNEPTA